MGRFHLPGFLSVLLILASFSMAYADDTGPDPTMVLPRFGTLASPEVNIRTGPGTRYPIDWVLRRKGMPIEIVQQFEHWRKIQTMDGTTGWVHKVMLNNYRSLIVTGAEPQVLFAKPDIKARVLARIAPGVIGKLERCQRDWCQTDIQGFEGWLPKNAFWGAYPTEKFDD